MIRDRLKKTLRRAAIKALGMEEQAEDRKEQEHRDVAFDPKYIPKVVDGSGDTPGPNHKTMIGRTWLSAQIAGGVSPCIVDIRPPEEWTAGHIRGAVLLPGRQILTQEKLLPAKDTRVVIVDAEGGPLSDEVAKALRDQGWAWARQLSGGWAEWIEHGEPEDFPTALDGSRFQLGSPVETASGEKGAVQALRKKGRGYQYDILVDYNGDVVLPAIAESKLKA